MKTKTQPKHTQGEWKINKYSSTTIESEKLRTIASCGSYSSNVEDSTSENEANAQRIVKAVNFLSIFEEFTKKYKEGYKFEHEEELCPDLVILEQIEQLLKQAEQK